MGSVLLIICLNEFKIVQPDQEPPFILLRRHEVSAGMSVFTRLKTRKYSGRLPLGHPNTPWRASEPNKRIRPLGLAARNIAQFKARFGYSPSSRFQGRLDSLP